MEEREPAPQVEASAGDGATDEPSWVAASSLVFGDLWADSAVRGASAEGAASGASKEAERRRRRVWRRRFLGAAILLGLAGGGVALFSYRLAAAVAYERHLLVEACESVETPRLSRVLACIELCSRSSAEHCAIKGDLYAGARDAAGAARAYREACALGDPRGCAKVSPLR
jgi:hypothetical protein